MFDTPNQVLAVADKLNVPRAHFDLVDADSWRPIFHAIIDTFCDRKIVDLQKSYLWEALVGEISSVPLIQPLDVRVLSALSEPEGRVFLLLEDWDGAKFYENYWLFDGRLADVLSILSEHRLVEFYLVAKKFEWLIGENHHNVVFASGEKAVSALGHVNAA